jgi:hypothetical protein
LLSAKTAGPGARHDAIALADSDIALADLQTAPMAEVGRTRLSEMSSSDVNGSAKKEKDRLLRMVRVDRGHDHLAMLAAHWVGLY